MASAPDRTCRWMRPTLALLALLLRPVPLGASPATLLFEDTFDRGIPGWTAVQPPGNYFGGPMLWEYDIVSRAFVEQSNIYTDAAGFSSSATAVMLINDTVATSPFTYRARLTAGDDDGFGLVFGYQGEGDFHRVTFTRQRRTTPGYPWNGWNVDRKVGGVATNLFGDGTPEHVESFVNTQYQPFDVILSVTGDNRFSLTVVDDPDGARTEWRLVEAQTLPGPADGRVGFLAWGMSGTALRGFRIADPVLEPRPLAGDPDALSQWSPVVTVRADGSGLDPGSGNGGQALWSLGLGANGAYGTLHEASDAFGGNTGDGTVDFAAASLVAGDSTWSNIVVSARILPADDDAHGLLLRFQDPSTFCRIALRSQESATGPPKGLSIQKAVGGVFEEVFREVPPAFDPLPGVPYDLTAVLVGNRLQLQVVSDPDGTPRTHSYGPIELSNDAPATGKIGVFSWGMTRTEFDEIRVHGIDGLPLRVTSAFGDPTPAPGLYGFTPGSTVSATVASPVEDAEGWRRIVTGWTGAGSVPATGTGSAVTFSLNTLSSLAWNWRTEVRLIAAAGAGGRVVGAPSDWVPEGTRVVLRAEPDAGHLFAGWTGDLASVESEVDLTLSRPLSVAARFEADADADGLPDAWEQRNFGGLSAVPDGDMDGDGKSNAAEWRRGTDPNHRESVSISDGPASRWVNVQRDPALSGALVVRDFGGGFRGLWENSNAYREAVDGRFIGPEFTVPGVSFEGPRIVLRPEAWDPAWNDGTATAVFSVGDNDGNCLYFRYRDERNWYRVTVCGENNNLAWRAPFGVSVQKRVNGVFTALVEDPSIATDPTDLAFYKRVRVSVTARGSDFQVRVAGWNAQAAPPGWDTAREAVYPFTDPDHPTGRVGLGTWGQGGGGPATDTNPVDAGALVESLTLEAGGVEVLRESWDQAPLASDLPPGWESPYTGGLAGAWQVTGHGTLLQTSDQGTPASTTARVRRADGEGPILLAPPLRSAQYLLEFAFHPFDDDGIGLVLDFLDTNNFARILFVSEPTAVGRVPQGVNISHKSDGAWHDVLVGDPSFVYRAGMPFAVELTRRNGEYRMTARSLDEPATARSWAWSMPAPDAARRFGLASWAGTDAHFFGVRASEMPDGPQAGDLRIASISITGGTLVLAIENPSGAPYSVARAERLEAGAWSVIAPNQTGTRWETPIPGGPGAAFFRLERPQP